MNADQRRRRGRPQPIDSILENVLDSTGLAGRMRDRRIMDDWEAVVGETAARHCRPVDYRDGVLTVEADHAAWRQELTLLAPVIIEKFNAIHGEGTVKSLSWSLRSTGRYPRDNDR